MGMTSEEIKIMAAGGKCRITNGAGQYLAYGKDRKIEFVDDKKRAFVYDYVKDNVPGQLEQVRQAFKAEWYAEAI
jgi:hypothetical protein